MKTKLILPAFAALLLAGCANDQPGAEAVIVPEYSFTAYQEGAAPTRTVVQDGGTTVYWSPGDEVAVFMDGNRYKFTTQNKELAEVAELKGNKDLSSVSADNPAWALYPFSYDYVKMNGTQISSIVSATQLASQGTFRTRNQITLARTENRDLTFHNVTGGIRFTMSEAGYHSVTIKSGAGEPLAGKIWVTMDENDRPVVKSVSEKSDRVSLDCTGSDSFVPGVWYYIVTLPCELKSGFSIELENEDGSIWFYTSKPVTIERGHFGSIPAIDASATYYEDPNPDPEPDPGPVVEVTSITLDVTDLVMTAGETQHLKPTIYPTNATDKRVSWSSSDDTVVSVSNAGYLTAKKAGKATITVTTVDGEKTATCAVTVNAAPVPVTGISVNPGTYTLAVGSTVQLTPTVKPTNATNKGVSWDSSDKSVASVSSTGLVTGKKKGKATITVKTNDGGFKAQSTITVTDATVHVTGVTVSPSSASVDVGKNIQLTANVEPGNASNKNVTWSSANSSIASVNNSGVVVGNKAGSTYIYATSVDGGKVGSCYVTVNEGYVQVQEVVISQSSASVNIDETIQLTASVKPDNASNKTISWYSDKKSVATVSSTGLVKGVTKGTTVIRAVASNGVESTCTVTVKEVEVSIITFNQTFITLTKGQSFKIEATVNPSNASYPGLTWSSSDTSVATVDQGGFVIAVSPGLAIINARASNGSNNNCRVFVGTDMTSMGSSYYDDAVDLGLSVKWSSYDLSYSLAYAKLGICSYFAWGETSNKAADTYDWNHYLWCKDGDKNYMTKYCYSWREGDQDDKYYLDPEDDAAQANLGGRWRIPTAGEWYELLTECEWENTNQNGLKGYKVSRNGKSIFIPKMGYVVPGSSDIQDLGYEGYFWTANGSGGYYLGITDLKESYYAKIASVRSNYRKIHVKERCNGLPVRPVWDLNK